MENRSVLQWDKDDCAAAGLVKFDLLGLGMLTMLHLAVDLVREHEGLEIDLATIPQEPAVYELLSAADTVGRLPGGEPRADGHAAPAATGDLLRPGGGGRADPAGTDPGRVGAPVPAAAQRRGGGHLPAPAPRAVPAQDPRGAAVPGAAHADGDRRGRLQRGRGRPAPPGHGIEAVQGAHGAPARPADGGDGRARDHRRDRGGDRAQARGVRQLRVPREPLGVVRVPRVREQLDQAAPSGRVRVRAAQRAADGLLLAAHAGARCPPPRSRGARPLRRARRAATARSSRARPRPDRSATRRPGWHADPSIRATRIGLRYVRGLARRAARPHRRGARQRALRRPGGLRPPDRGSRRRAGGPRHRRCVRLLRRRPARRAVGRGCAAATRAPVTCPTPPWGSRRPPCPG